MPHPCGGGMQCQRSRPSPPLTPTYPQCGGGGTLHWLLEYTVPNSNIQRARCKCPDLFLCRHARINNPNQSAYAAFYKQMDDEEFAQQSQQVRPIYALYIHIMTCHLSLQFRCIYSHRLVYELCRLPMALRPPLDMRMVERDIDYVHNITANWEQ